MPPLSSSFSISLSLSNPRFHTLPSSSLLPTIVTSRRSLILTMSFSSSASSPSPSVSNPKESSQDQEVLQVLKYHNQTKHSFTRYARGPHGLDWANQPNPFRRYVSAPLVPLLHYPIENQKEKTQTVEAPLYSSLFLSSPPKSISKSTISQFFYDSLALSAWKTAGFSTWSLRVNPSSGNLHPTEGYIIAPPIESVSSSGFVAHYAPKEHALEIRADIPSEFFPKFFPKDSFLIGLSSIFWREAWKYGERAFRYCNHDVGHAIAAVSMAAAAVGKIPEIEFEHPDCVLAVFPNGVGKFDVDYKELSSAISKFSKLDWKGKPNLLSKEHICWDIIYRTAEVVKRPLMVGNESLADPFQCSGLYSEDAYKQFTVREVVRKRRSAVDMDGVTVMRRDTFYQIMLHCLPSGSQNGMMQKRQLALPFGALSWDAEVHAALFVHRVAGLPQGLYFLVRNEDHSGDLRNSMRSDFKWTKPEGCPDDLPLYELDKGDYGIVAERLSCHQEIASHGCFSLGMVARFEPTLREKSVWMYPRLFWETGVLGQVLYLEAHAVGISATGIGCYFDDHVHELLGLKGSKFQSLYHFTVGGPVLDRRIMSLPAYPGPGIDA
ncbi:hypothetical protein FNV43_RR18280 [Rhamnella rubrinervis]|uniref:Nitroreductase domain-containing protein n=1 Tax=Rhamnella rubrinervis TaxID=2594499 RepID=A0A8K0EAV2_9ROSA|nr:hypothetical protein FNV43_RR18280 [Rhamnella rubrinervis]